MSWTNEGQTGESGGGTDQQDVVDNQKAIAENNELIVDNGGRLDSVEASVSTLNGVVDSDGVPYANVKNVPLATGTTAGVVRPDNITIRSANGVLTVDVAAAEKRAVSTEAFMLGLPLIQNLYIVTRSDVNRIFYLNAGEDPAILSNWIQGASTLDAVSSFNGRNGAVLPNTGDYSVSDITDLQAELDAKQDNITPTNRIPASNVSLGNVSDAEFSHLSGVTSNIQDQLDSTTGYDPYPGLSTQRVILFDGMGDSACMLLADDSDTGIALEDAQTVVLSLGVLTDFAIKDGASTDVLRVDNNRRALVTALNYVPNAFGSQNIGSTTRAFGDVFSNRYRWSPASGTAYVMPLCVGMIQLSRTGTVEYRNTSNLSGSRTDTGKYNVTVGGSLSTALSNSAKYWYTVNTIDDGDNIYSATSQTTTGCSIQSRDSPDFGYQDSTVVVQVWVVD